MSNFNKKIWSSLVMTVIAATTIPGILSAIPYQTTQNQPDQGQLIAQRDRDSYRMSSPYRSDRDWDRRQYYEFDQQYYGTPSSQYGNYNYNDPNNYYNYPQNYYNNNPQNIPGVDSNYNFSR